MTVLIKLFYAGAITALFILLAAFGVKTFYDGPKAPTYPEPPGSIRVKGPTEAQLVPAPTAEDLRQYEAAQRQYNESYEQYRDERADYRRNVFLVITALSLGALIVGANLEARYDAVRLGLIAGGLGSLIYGVAQEGEDLGRIGPATIFVISLIGVVLLLGAGYRWLSLRP